MCKIGERNYNNVYVEVEKGDDNVVYKITGAPDDAVQDDTDVDMIKEGYITVTTTTLRLNKFHLNNKNGKYIRKINWILTKLLFQLL